VLVRLSRTQPEESSVRRPALLLVLLGALAAFLRRRSAASRAEQDLWREATTAPDLR
jgi:MYXO-CTERM domain-containing protein